MGKLVGIENTVEIEEMEGGRGRAVGVWGRVDVLSGLTLGNGDCSWQGIGGTFAVVFFWG